MEIPEIIVAWFDGTSNSLPTFGNCYQPFSRTPPIWKFLSWTRWALSKNTLFIIICALLPESICLILLLKCLILHVSLGSLSDGFELGSTDRPLGFEGSNSSRELGLEGSSSSSDHKMIGLNEKEAKVRLCGLVKERKERNMG